MKTRAPTFSPGELLWVWGGFLVFVVVPIIYVLLIG